MTSERPRCKRRKMMGRGAGCGAEDKPCPVSRVTVSAQTSSNSLEVEEEESIDLYSQARKALSEKSPFEAEEAASRISTLPVSLAVFLTKCYDSRAKHKRALHPDSASKVAGHGGVSGQSWARNVWTEMEQFFRPVALEDMERLFLHSQFGSAFDYCFSVPLAKNVEESADVSAGNGVCENAVEVRNVVEGAGSESFKTVEEKLEEVEEMEIDSGISEGLPQNGGENLSVTSSASNGLHWLLGSKHKVLLTSDRPSKKRKLLGEKTGLERLVVCSPRRGDSVFCDVCCSGDAGDRSNSLLFCISCNVAVHQKCYGVTGVSGGRWLCNWCKHREHLGTGLDGKPPRNDGLDFSVKPCLLCPKEGGVVKPVRDAGRSENGTGFTFAHLFCGQWLPEVYVENTETVEHIINIDGIKETRRKLVCYLCKVKYGVCVRCSHGTCRTSFHPICAREAKHRMEIWGKFGFDNVELRAFCLKHSASQENMTALHSANLMPDATGGDSSVPKILPVTLPGTRLYKLKLGRNMRDKCMVNDKIADTDSDEVIPNMESTGIVESNNIGNDTPSVSANLVQLLKKLLAQGKTNVSDVALQMGNSSNSLATALEAGDISFLPDLRLKIINWLQKSAHMATSVEYLKQRNDCRMSSGSQAAEADGPNDVRIAGQQDPGGVLVKRLPPRRIMKSNVRSLKDNEMICSPGKNFVQQNSNEIMIEEISEDSIASDEDMTRDGSANETKFCGHDISTEPQVPGKKLREPSGDFEFHASTLGQLSEVKGEPVNGESCNLSKVQVVKEPAAEECSVGSENGKSNGANSAIGKEESATGSYIHPSTSKRLMEVQNCFVPKQRKRILENDGQRQEGMSSKEATSGATVCPNHQSYYCSYTDMNHVTEIKDQLVKARRMGILELSPEDEVEGEILYFQNRLLDNAASSRHLCEDLTFRVVMNLPHELDALRKQRWDAVLVNQYLCEVREAKKLGRKERRHREAEAALAAAAASSRMSASRKDALDGIVATHNENPVKMNTARARPYSQMISCTKETLSKLAVSKLSSEQTEIFHLFSEFSKENPRSCDICGRNESMIKRVSVCSNCKVAVHLSCYWSIKDGIGPWYCEPCEESLLHSGSPRTPYANTCERFSFVAQCGLCGGSNGAFRKTTDGQWVHAFCAEWLLESTFQRGQPNHVEGREAISKERNLLICCICNGKVGLCIKCNYGHCLRAFHPTCAKNAGWYMNVKTVAGKFQHRVYCEKHSLGQRQKAESIQHAAELWNIKQIRVELERVRLLCERIIKRERVKRELVLCSHDILAGKRDYVALSVLVHSSFFPPDVSSESATTSLKGLADDTKSCCEAMQISDDVTVDCRVSGKHRVVLPMQVNIDRKTDDSSTSKQPCAQKPTDGVSFSGKQLPQRSASVASRNPADGGEKTSKSRKHTETFQKELVMTSDQATMQNQRLPKGFAYVPVGCLSKEVGSHDATHESIDPDG